MRHLNYCHLIIRIHWQIISYENYKNSFTLPLAVKEHQNYDGQGSGTMKTSCLQPPQYIEDFCQVLLPEYTLEYYWKPRHFKFSNEWKTLETSTSCHITASITLFTLRYYYYSSHDGPSKHIRRCWSIWVAIGVTLDHLLISTCDFRSKSIEFIWNMKKYLHYHLQRTTLAAHVLAEATPLDDSIISTSTYWMNMLIQRQDLLVMTAGGCIIAPEVMPLGDESSISVIP